ncbi:MAG: hypothetical protein NTY19_23945 [Planctomycetota bacterium]|nr:hypothetical protein [Planctomycetota bacterium]
MSTLTTAEIDGIELCLGFRLPGLYLRLLQERGFGRFGAAAEIYHPLDVRELYEAYFDDPTKLFNPYFPFGCQTVKQVLWVIDGSIEKAATIGHEIVADDWGQEEWLPYETWVERYLEPEA